MDSNTNLYSRYQLWQGGGVGAGQQSLAQLPWTWFEY